jgi:hypothetical protein
MPDIEISNETALEWLRNDREGTLNWIVSILRDTGDRIEEALDELAAIDEEIADIENEGKGS